MALVHPLLCIFCCIFFLPLLSYSNVIFSTHELWGAFCYSVPHPTWDDMREWLCRPSCELELNYDILSTINYELYNENQMQKTSEY